MGEFFEPEEPDDAYVEEVFTTRNIQKVLILTTLSIIGLYGVLFSLLSYIFTK